MVDYDFIVIGGGSGGVRAARIAAQAGAKVALIEGSALGGTCVNVGCVPKKLFTYAAQFGQDFQDAKGYGWSVSEPQFDWPTLISNKDREIKRLNTIYAANLKKTGVEIIAAWGQYQGFEDSQHQIALSKDLAGKSLTGEVIQAPKILLATGGEPRRPSFPGAEHVLLSDDLFYLERLPKRLVIIGGGYIALEFACIFAQLGVEVHVMVRSEILRGFDEDLQAWLSEGLEQLKVQVHLQSSVQAVTKTETGLALTYSRADDEQAQTLEADQICAAIGRIIRLPTGLEALELEQAQIKVDAQLQTSVPGCFAVGDLLTTPALTPVAIRQGQWLAQTLFSDQAPTKDWHLPSVPTAVFTQPSLATVGATEAELRECQTAYKVYKSDFRPLKHVLAANTSRVGIKLLVSKDAREQVLGLHMSGAEGPELVQALAVGFDLGMCKADLDRTLAVHPTVGEEWVTLN